ncbi:MAG: polysaccharide biosynthesis C-terminal domain-containing protein, partial [Candidatus Borkfalkiaceae bacterium]|nr:polysaccharide biosynthesis C-terminal domain-containing protein [Christensenellaceae bacterium]
VTNKVKIQAVIDLICGGINVAISFMLSKCYGVIGACISICIAYIVKFTLLIIVDKKVMGFDMKQFAIQCYLRMISVIIVTLGLGILINYFIADGGWFKLILKAFIIIVIYLISVIAFGLSKYERKNILNKICTNLFKLKNK